MALPRVVTSIVTIGVYGLSEPEFFAALQAAQAYAHAPCDRFAKTMFIVAASTYLRAQDQSSQAPKDARVHDAIKVAFQTGHVSANEFPPDLMISGRFAPAPPSRASCVNSAGLRP